MSSNPVTSYSNASGGIQVKVDETIVRFTGPLHQELTQLAGDLGVESTELVVYPVSPFGFEGVLGSGWNSSLVSLARMGVWDASGASDRVVSW